jgi:hypothetical protein
MDGDAADELLLPGTDDKAFEEARTQAVTSIVSAAENITFGDAERGPIQKLALGVGTYTAAVQTARDKQAAGDKSYLATWRAAALNIMDESLLPAAVDLDGANRRELDKAYEGQRNASVQASVVLFLGGVLMGGVLIGLQIFLAGRTRRILNPPLVAATLGTLVFLIYAGQRFAASDRDLKVAKADAFESIHVLWQARAVAYAANSDERRFLLDPGGAAKYGGDYQARSKQVEDLLEAEMKNLTFEGEGEAASEAVAQFAEYRKIDQQIRYLERNGKHSEAVALCTGAGKAQSTGVFTAFDGALGRTLDVNQKAFDGAVARGFVDVAGFEVKAPVAAFAISVLGWLGLRPRIREYSV